MLHPQSGTLSLTKSGHPTPSHPSKHHLKLIFFSSSTDLVWGWGGKERERVREGERERELVICCKVLDFFVSTYFVSCNGPCAPKEKWHRKEHIIICVSV